MPDGVVANTFRWLIFERAGMDDLNTAVTKVVRPHKIDDIAVNLNDGDLLNL
ncbi:hypothetical protein D3C87_2063190 [compost metagenome]